MNDYFFDELISCFDVSHKAELMWFQNEKDKLISWKDIPNAQSSKKPQKASIVHQEKIIALP